MKARFRTVTVLLFLILALVCGSASVSARGVGVSAADKVPAADPVLNALARDLEREESLRAVKDLQRNYAQYAMYGLWDEMASLFTDEGKFIIYDSAVSAADNFVTYNEEGLAIDWPKPKTDLIITGQANIAGYLLQTRGDGVHQGIPAGGLNAEFIDNGVTNLSADGKTAYARLMALRFGADGNGGTTIEGGIYENEYALENGVWKISTVNYYPHYAGDYQNGWTMIGGYDTYLALTPYHFGINDNGVPIPKAEGVAPHSPQSIKQLEERIDRLNDEDAVRNLQHAYGFYVDRKMWNDVVDLFADDSKVQIETASGSEAYFKGKAGVRQAMEKYMGPSPDTGSAGLLTGEGNNRPIFDTIVDVVSDNEAYTRGIELGMLAKCDLNNTVNGQGNGEGWWTISVFRNRFVKEDGIWKMKELRYYNLMRADFYAINDLGQQAGWGADGQVPDQMTLTSPSFLTDNPVTGKPVDMLGLNVDSGNLTGKIKSNRGNHNAKLSHAERLNNARLKLQRSYAWDATENVNSVYGYYLDDVTAYPFYLAGVFAQFGNKQVPFSGFNVGRVRINAAAQRSYGAPNYSARNGMSYHWLTQQIILVSDDARSTSSTTRLFQPRAKGNGVNANGNYSGMWTSVFSTGMYPNNQSVAENSYDSDLDGVNDTPVDYDIWRLATLAIDEAYQNTPNWETGFAKVRYRAPGTFRPTLFPDGGDHSNPTAPDVFLQEIRYREDGFSGGTGSSMPWPQILPVWFNYRNPVSGVVPVDPISGKPRYWPGSVIKENKPESTLEANGYQEPSTGPGAEPIWEDIIEWLSN